MHLRRERQPRAKCWCPDEYDEYEGQSAREGGCVEWAGETDTGWRGQRPLRLA